MGNSDAFMAGLRARHAGPPPLTKAADGAAGNPVSQCYTGRWACAHLHAPPAMERERNASRRRTRRRRLASVNSTYSTGFGPRPPVFGGNPSCAQRRGTRQQPTCQDSDVYAATALSHIDNRAEDSTTCAMPTAAPSARIGTARSLTASGFQDWRHASSDITQADGQSTPAPPDVPRSTRRTPSASAAVATAPARPAAPPERPAMPSRCGWPSTPLQARPQQPPRPMPERDPGQQHGAHAGPLVVHEHRQHTGSQQQKHRPIARQRVHGHRRQREGEQDVERQPGTEREGVQRLRDQPHSASRRIDLRRSAPGWARLQAITSANSGKAVRPSSLTTGT